MRTGVKHDVAGSKEMAVMTSRGGDHGELKAEAQPAGWLDAGWTRSRDARLDNEEGGIGDVAGVKKDRPTSRKRFDSGGSERRG
jgi:hypothetical protein